MIFNYIMKKENTIIGREARALKKENDMWIGEVSFENEQKYLKRYCVKEVNEDEFKLNSLYYNNMTKRLEKNMEYNEEFNAYTYSSGEKIYVKDNIYATHQIYDFLPRLCKEIEIGEVVWFKVYNILLDRIVYYNVRKESKHRYYIIAPEATVLEYDKNDVLLYRNSYVNNIVTYRA